MTAKGTMQKESILIIKHGALGDMILATGPMKAIRQHHPEAHIVLLTGKSFVALMKNCPFINEILTDTKPKPWKLGGMRMLAGMLRCHRYSWVYDLQTSSRSTWYYHLLPSPKPQISSLHKRASHRHNTPERTKLHTIDRQKQQLQIAGITEVPEPDISWLKAEHNFALNKPYALLVPGGSAHRPAKRWPSQRYAELALWLSKQGITPVLLGAGAEEALLTEIQNQCSPLAGEPTRTCDSVGGNHNQRTTSYQPPPIPPTGSLQSPTPPQGGSKILNLCNQTSCGDIAELARNATIAIGNDTGPMHIIAATGCPSLVLFSSNESNPDLCAPRGKKVGILNVADLQSLPLDGVTGELKRLHLLDLR